MNTRVEDLLESLAEVEPRFVFIVRASAFAKASMAFVLTPRSPLRNSAAVCKIARRALTRAGIVNTPAAAHLFRHASATRMLTSGASFNEIADVLGHVSLKTTAIYAKLDLATLSAVSLPWPGSKP